MHWHWVGLTGMVSLSACGASVRENGSEASGAGAASGSGSAASDGGQAGAPQDARQCRLQGYGIGPLSTAYCDALHSMAHAAQACLQLGGELSGEAGCHEQEYRVSCCFADAIPPIDAPMPTSPLGEFTPLPAEDGGSTRELLLAAAEAKCAENDGAGLGDWIVYYAGSSETALGLQYFCVQVSDRP